jgi:hypothetical protein
MDLLIVDTSVAAIFLDSARSSLLDSDSAEKVQIKKNKKLRKRYIRDTMLVNHVFESDTVRFYKLSTYRDSLGLFADIVVDYPDYGLLLGRVIETHWLWRVDLWGDSLHLVPFDDAWLTQAIDSGWVKTAVEHQFLGPRPDGHHQVSYILAGETEEIERVLRAAQPDTNAFPARYAITFRLWRRPSGP